MVPEAFAKNAAFLDEAELLDGVSLKDGVTLRKVYFDVSAYVAGRLSRAAAVAVVAASLH